MGSQNSTFEFFYDPNHTTIDFLFRNPICNGIVMICRAKRPTNGSLDPGESVRSAQEWMKCVDQPL